MLAPELYTGGAVKISRRRAQSLRHGFQLHRGPDQMLAKLPSGASMTLSAAVPE